MQLPISPIKLFDQPTLYIRTTRHVPFTNKFLHHQLANRFHFLTDKYLFTHSFIHLLFATASFPSSLKANSSAFACKRFIALSLSLSLDSTNLSLLNVWSGFVWLITCCNHDNWIPIHNFQHSSNTSLFLFLPSYYITYLSHLSCDNWNFWQCLHVVFYWSTTWHLCANWCELLYPKLNAHWHNKWTWCELWLDSGIFFFCSLFNLESLVEWSVSKWSLPPTKWRRVLIWMEILWVLNQL